MGLATIIRKEKAKQGEYRILILGLDNAGKSSVLKRWLNSNEAVSPTFGFQIKTLHLSDTCHLNFWDIGGQKSIRPFWRNYYEETDAIVWVIDSADADRLIDCRRELESVLTADRLNGASLLILANKSDCPGALPLETLKNSLGLDRLNSSGHTWSIFASSALSGANINESLQWLTTTIQARRGK